MDFDGVQTWKDNFSIYKENLSVYYILSIVISFLSVFITWWYHKYNSRHYSSDDRSELIEHVDNTNETSKDSCDPVVSEDKDPNGDIVKRISLVVKESQSALRLISSGMTEEQIKEEKAVESQQLAEIFKVLQNQQDKFNVNSIEELEDQMKLYR